MKVRPVASKLRKHLNPFPLATKRIHASRRVSVTRSGNGDLVIVCADSSLLTADASLVPQPFLSSFFAVKRRCFLPSLSRRPTILCAAPILVSHFSIATINHVLIRPSSISENSHFFLLRSILHLGSRLFSTTGAHVSRIKTTWASFLASRNAIISIPHSSTGPHPTHLFYSR